MKIVSVERRRGHQYLLSLSDGNMVSVNKSTWEESPCQEGDEISEEQLDALITASDERRAREYALYLLSLRDYSEADLKRKMREKGYAAQAADVAARMRELGFLNDEVYASRLARDCRLRKMYSARRTVQEICLHGVAKEVALAAVEEVDAAENTDDLQQALALLRKKRYNVPVTEQLYLKGSHLLQRNGYDGYTVRAAWRLLEEESESEYTETGD